MDWILEPWPWYVSGPLIALIMFLLIFIGKRFGMSSNLATICTMCGADQSASYFDFNWKEHSWNLLVVLGAIIGGFIAAHWLSNDVAVNINPVTIGHLQELGFQSAGKEYLPRNAFWNGSLSQILKSLVDLARGWNPYRLWCALCRRLYFWPRHFGS